MPGSGGDGGVLPDYFRVPIGASWRTRLIGRFPEIGKPWNRAKNDHVRLSCEVRMMLLLWDATPGNRSLKIVDYPEE